MKFKYKVTMHTGITYMHESNIVLDGVALNIDHHKSWWITNDVVINCRYIQSIEVVK